MNTLPLHRILAIDDNRAIHDDYRKIFCPEQATIDDAEAEFFGEAKAGFTVPPFQIDSAYQGEEGVEMLRAALARGEPYSLAFVDVRMPPGIDGVETAEKLWALCPDLQVVICTAFSDCSWETMLGRLGHRDRLLVLKKPFTSVEALQIACALTEKSALTRKARQQLAETERIVAERTGELRESEQLFRQIAENIEGIFWITTPDLRTTHYLSPGAARVLGRSQESLVQDPRSWLGSFFAQAELDQAAESESQLVLGDGSLHWMRNRCFPVRDGSGAVVRICGIAEDVTQRREAEEAGREMEMQLRHAQKLESIGQLAAGIAHEINTPTQYIGDNTQFLQDGFRDLSGLLTTYGTLFAMTKSGAVTPEMIAEVECAEERADLSYLVREMPRAIEQSLQGVKRVSEIVGAMKDFSHPGGKDKSCVDLNRAIESTITVASNEWKYVAEMVTELDEMLPCVWCLPGEINQVILNMIVNASHAIADVVKEGEKGTIRVCTQHDHDWVEIRIADSGAGIPPEIRQKIFDPFFTTKEVGKGTGQGLSIAHSVIVDKHHGTIAVESEVGRGTTFIIRLPVSENAAGEIAA